jgi:hypothetical protein
VAHHPLPRLHLNGDEVDLYPLEKLLKLDETIHSVADHEILKLDLNEI